MNNFDNIFSGRLAEKGVELLSSPEIGFRKEILLKYVGDDMKPSKVNRCSYWYLKRGDRHVEVSYFAPDFLLGIVVTNPDEEAARDRVLDAYGDDWMGGLLHFSKELVRCKRQGLPMTSIKTKESFNEKVTA